MRRSRTRTKSIGSSTDAALVARIAAGDEGALATLYDRHASLAYSLSHAITRRQSDAEDAVAAAFRRAWNQAATYDPSQGSVLSWVLSLVRREALALRADADRRQVVRLERDEDVARFTDTRAVAPRPVDGGGDGGPAPLRAEVALALGGLSELERRAIELAFFRGLAVPEIAAQLQEPEYTIGTQLRSAMEHLRVSLSTRSTMMTDQPVTQA